jgi:branched-chain amino acid transport system ATP-binding protein
MVPVLEIRDLSMSFGGLNALQELSLAVRPKEIIALIGPNGAGKTTFFNCITGIYTPTGGDVLLSVDGRNQERLNGLKPNRITSKGMARTFQNIRLFPDMTVLENVMIGRHCRSRAGIIGAFFRGPRTVQEEKEIVEKSHRILKKMGLAKFAGETAKNLPYGAQRRLEIARALATDPCILLLDEPAAGMNPQETKELDDLIKQVRDEEHIAILLIEHDMRLVMSISDRIVVMDYGRKIAEGSPREVRENAVVIKAYLGEQFDA